MLCILLLMLVGLCRGFDTNFSGRNSAMIYPPFWPYILGIEKNILINQ